MAQRRNSMDIREEFRAFATEFDKCRQRMKEIVDELDEICRGTSDKKKEVPRKATAAAVGCGLVAGLLVAPFTGGVSLVAAGAAASAAGAAVAGVYRQDKKCDQQTVDKSNELITEFLEIVEPLKENLEAVKTSLKEQNRDTEDLVRTQTRTQDVFSLLHAFKSESTVERLLEVSGQCRRMLKELETLRSIGAP